MQRAADKTAFSLAGIVQCSHNLNHTIGGGREYLGSYSCGLGGGRREGVEEKT